MPTTLAAILGVLVFVLRPTAIGEVYSFPLAAAIAAIAVALLLSNMGRAQLQVFRHLSPQISLFLLIVFYVSARNLVSGGTAAENGVKFFFISLSGALALAAVSLNAVTQRKFFDTLAFLVIMSCISVTITFLLISTGLKATSIRIFHFSYTYINRGDVLFPFTFSFNEVKSWLGPAPRLSGIFREPGILPAFACWAAAYAHFRKWPFAVSVIALVGSAFSLSSFGVPFALYTGALLTMAKLRIRTPVALVSLAALGVLAWPIIYGVGNAGVGIGGKIASDSISFRERMYLIELAFSAKNIVFGDGTSGLYRANEGISLFSQIRIYGLVYFASILGLYAFAAKNMRLLLYGLVPAFVTVLISQPIALDVPLVAIFMSYAVFAVKLTQPKQTPQAIPQAGNRA